MKKNSPQTFYWDASTFNSTKLSSNSYFFNEDMAQYAYFYNNKNIEFELLPEEKTLTNKLAPIISIDRNHFGYKYQDLTESIKSLIESIISNLFFFGNAYYELYENKYGLHLLNISNDTIKEFLRFYFQILPLDLAKKKNNSSRINIIDRNDIIKFTFPKQLGGVKRLKQIKSKILKTDSDIYLKEMNLRMEGKGNKYFDPEHFQYKSKITLARYCYDLGWYKRGIDISDISDFNEYSQIRLILNQKRTTAIIRQDILNQINGKLLPKILKCLEVENLNNYLIKAKNMENSRYYEELLTELKNGSKSLKELREIVFKP